jgi:hypothetical protein
MHSSLIALTIQDACFARESEQKSKRVPLKVKPAGIEVDLGVPRRAALPVNTANHFTPAPPLRQEKSGPFATVTPKQQPLPVLWILTSFQSLPCAPHLQRHAHAP